MNRKLLLLALALPFSIIPTARALPTTGAEVTTPVQTISGEQLRGVSRIDELFNLPNSLRPMVTDRGGPSPVTVGAGNVNVGWMTSYSFRNHNFVGSMSSTFSEQIRVGLPTLEVGVLNNLDVQLWLPSFEVNNTLNKSPLGRDFNRESGFTDLTLGAKYSVLAGKDGYGWAHLGTGAIGWSVLSEVTFPTASADIDNHDYYRGGFRSELDYICDCGWELRMANGVTFGENDFGCWNACFCNDFYVHTPEFGQVISGYVGFESTVSTSPRRDWEGYVNVGMIYKAQPNLQFFAETGITVTTDQPEIRFAAGIDWRFNAFPAVK